VVADGSRVDPAAVPPTAADIDAISRGTGLYCRGGDVDSRRCHASHLCYLRGDLAAVRGPETTFVGVPVDRFNPALLTLGTVLQHNALHASVVDIPSDEMRLLAAAGRLLVVRGTALLVHRFMPSNVMHAMHDDVLPMLHTMRELGLLGQTNATVVFVDKHGMGSASDTLYAAAQPSSIPTMHLADVPQDTAVCFRSIHLGLSKATTWYQYGFHTAQGPTDGTHPAALRAAVDSLRRGLALRGGSAGVVREAKASDWNVVVLTRSRNRRILNRGRLVLELRRRFRRKVVQLSLETHSLAEMSQRLRSAGVVVGMHGSILAAAAFLHRGAVLVELFPFGVVPKRYTPYRTLARLMDIQYVAWVNPNESATVTHPEWPSAFGGVAHLPSDQQQLIMSTREVPPHLCCTDPFWLYRIFSDTIVDARDVVRNIPEPFASADGAGLADDTDPDHVTGEPEALVPATNSDAVRCTSAPPGLLTVRFEPSWSTAYTPRLFYEVQIDEFAKRWSTSDPYLVVNATATPVMFERRTLSVWIRSRTTLRVGRFVHTVCTIESSELE